MYIEFGKALENCKLVLCNTFKKRKKFEMETNNIMIFVKNNNM